MITASSTLQTSSLNHLAGEGTQHMYLRTDAYTRAPHNHSSVRTDCNDPALVIQVSILLKKLQTGGTVGLSYKIRMHEIRKEKRRPFFLKFTKHHEHTFMFMHLLDFQISFSTRKDTVHWIHCSSVSGTYKHHLLAASLQERFTTIVHKKWLFHGKYRNGCAHTAWGQWLWPNQAPAMCNKTASS